MRPGCTAVFERVPLLVQQLANSQSGEAYKQIPGLSTSDDFTVRYQMYTGDGTGADGQCINVGANTLDGRYGRDERGIPDNIQSCVYTLPL